MKMRSIVGGALVTVGLVCLPLMASAAEFRGGQDRVTITAPIDDNLYVAAGNVSVDAPVTGDLFVAGGQVRVSGPVSGDLFVAGGNVDVVGDVQGDVRSAGGQVMLSGHVSGDVLAFSGDVQIAQTAVVDGDTDVYGGQVVIAGQTHRVGGAMGQLVIDGSAHIEGDVDYMSEHDAQVAAAGVISGKVVRHIPPHAKSKVAGVGFLAVGGAMWALVSVLMACLFGYGLPVKARALMQDWRRGFGKGLLWGVIALVVTPFVGFVLLMSGVGLPLAFILFVVYGLMLYLAKLVMVLAVGARVQSIWSKDKHGGEPLWAAAVVGVVVVGLVGLVPILGPLAVFVVWLASLGVLLQYDWALVQDLRKRKRI